MIRSLWRAVAPFGAVVATCLFLSACATTSYETSFNACDNQAELCYRGCESQIREAGYVACQSRCKAEIDRCFARAYDAYRYARSSYATTVIVNPWYGRYGIWAPAYGYRFSSLRYNRYGYRRAFRAPRYVPPRRGPRYVPPRRGPRYAPPRRGRRYVPPRRGRRYAPPRRGRGYVPPRRGRRAVPPRVRRGPPPRARRDQRPPPRSSPPRSRPPRSSPPPARARPASPSRPSGPSEPRKEP